MPPAPRGFKPFFGNIILLYFIFNPEKQTVTCNRLARLIF
jgi:hypothetical protein